LVRDCAKRNEFAELPADIYVRNYFQLKAIAKDNMAPCAMERVITVYWGATGTGKSKRAWDEAGLDAYPKDPCTKFWDGYRDQQHVVIDEFRGDINISHVLRWFDRYPVNVEQKHGACTLLAKRIWITSNINPDDWYMQINNETRLALLRRMTIIEFTKLEGLETLLTN
jgi:RNA helicase